MIVKETGQSIYSGNIPAQAGTKACLRYDTTWGVPWEAQRCMKIDLSFGYGYGDGNVYDYEHEH